MKVGSLIAAVLCLLCGGACGQERNAVWYFGSHAGLDFNTAPPAILLDNRTTGGFACGSICDTTGVLLFYSSPDTLFNSIHDTLTNGCDLYADPVRMSGIIVPRPSYPNEYYVFEAKSGGFPDYDPKALYHRVDVSGDGGNGLLLDKNVVLYDSVSTMVTAIPHANGIDYWALYHEWGSDRWLAFLVNTAGVDPVPVTSEAGEVHYDPPGLAVTAVGCLKPSADGRMLALAKTRSSSDEAYLDLFRFDATTGVVSDQLRIGDHEPFFAAEFSPDGLSLYATIFRCEVGETNDLVQYDIATLDSAVIVASRTVLYAASYETNCDGSMGVITQGPDGKLYVPIRYETYLGVINEPNVHGIGCDYQHMSISLGGQINNLTLPNQMKFQDSTSVGIMAWTSNLGCLMVWPSPTTDGIWLQLPSGMNSDEVQIDWIDAVGCVARVDHMAGTGPLRIDRAGLASGSYFLKVASANGTWSVTGRAIFL